MKHSPPPTRVTSKSKTNCLKTMTEAKETIHIYIECGLRQALKSFGVKLINEILIFLPFDKVLDLYQLYGVNKRKSCTD